MCSLNSLLSNQSLFNDDNGNHEYEHLLQKPESSTSKSNKDPISLLTSHNLPLNMTVKELLSSKSSKYLNLFKR